MQNLAGELTQPEPGTEFYWLVSPTLRLRGGVNGSYTPSIGGLSTFLSVLIHQK